MRMIQRQRLGIWVMLIVGMLSCSACATKPPPSVLPDGRTCYLGAVPPWSVAEVRTWAPQAQTGDLLISPACDDESTERILNEIRRNTR